MRFGMLPDDSIQPGFYLIDASIQSILSSGSIDLMVMTNQTPHLSSIDLNPSMISSNRCFHRILSVSSYQTHSIDLSNQFFLSTSSNWSFWSILRFVLVQSNSSDQISTIRSTSSNHFHPIQLIHLIRMIPSNPADSNWSNRWFLVAIRLVPIRSIISSDQFTITIFFLAGDALQWCIDVCSQSSLFVEDDLWRRLDVCSLSNWFHPIDFIHEDASKSIASDWFHSTIIPNSINDSSNDLI